MTRDPQVLRNVAVGSREGLDDAGAVWSAVAAAYAQVQQKSS